MCYHPSSTEYKIIIGKEELYVVLAQRIYIKAMRALLATIKDKNPSASKEEIKSALEEHYSSDQILFYDKEPSGCYMIAF